MTGNFFFPLWKRRFKVENRYYKQALKASILGYEWTRVYQDLDRDSDTYGGYKGGYLNGDTGLVESAAWGSGIAFANAIALYLCTDSPYHDDPEMLTHALLNFEDMERNQNEDGTWDLRNSNYHDATAAAFTIEQLYPTYCLLKKYESSNPELSSLKTRLEVIFKKGGEGILSGGFHTPNHRWAIAAALSYLYAEFKDERYLEEARRYLAEGIDIHEDGSFSEKSIGNYDAVVDMALLALAENFNMRELIGYVERNLRLVSRMIQPDGTLYSFSSFRQDSRMSINFNKYWRVFKKMAVLTGDSRWIYTFSYLGGDDIDNINRNGIEFEYLSDEMLHPINEIKEETLIDRAEGCFLMSHLGLGRVLGNGYTVTVSSSNPGIIHLKKGEIDMFLSIYSSFFSRGQFKADDIRYEDGSFILHKSVEYGYIRPFDKKPDTNVWEDMDHGTWANVRLFNTPGLYPDWKDIDFGSRGHVKEQRLEYSLTLTPEENALEIKFCIKGPSRLPYKLDFSFIAGGRVFSSDIDMKVLSEAVLFAKRGEFTYRKATDEIHIGPCFSSHHADEMRGEEIIDRKRFHLCLSGIGCDERKIRLSWN